MATPKRTGQNKETQEGARMRRQTWSPEPDLNQRLLLTKQLHHQTMLSGQSRVRDGDILGIHPAPVDAHAHAAVGLALLVEPGDIHWWRQSRIISMNTQAFEIRSMCARAGAARHASIATKRADLGMVRRGTIFPNRRLAAGTGDLISVQLHSPFDGRGYWGRTSDICLVKAALYQLS